MDIQKLKTAREEYEATETELKEAIDEYDKAISEVRKEALKVCDEKVSAAKEKEGVKVKEVQERLHAKQKEYNEVKDEIQEELQKAGLVKKSLLGEFFETIYDDGFSRVRMRRTDIPDPRDVNSWPNIPLWICPTFFRKGRDTISSNNTTSIRF